MICISLWQPWASALFAPDSKTGLHAIKLHETRSWPMPKHYVNSWIGIHAAKRDTPVTREAFENVACSSVEFTRAFDSIGVTSYGDLPRGYVIGKIMFGPSSPTDKFGDWWKDMSRQWGDYTPGRWAWPVVQFQRFAIPIPVVGRQGFFEADLSTAVAA